MLTDDIILSKINDYIEALPFNRKPQSLYEPIRYVLSIGENVSGPHLPCWLITCLRTTPRAFLHPLADWKPIIITRFCTTT